MSELPLSFPQLIPYLLFSWLSMMFSFVLLLSSLPVLVLGANVSLVREVDSLLVIQESINVRKIDLHLHLWARELSLSSEKLDRLMGSRELC